MKHYLDTEFHDYQKKPLFGKPINTIDLISIGIVTEDYTISHTLKYKGAKPLVGEVGNTWDRKTSTDLPDLRNKAKVLNAKQGGWTVEPDKTSLSYYAICKEFDLKAAWENKWLRENVLRHVYDDLVDIAREKRKHGLQVGISIHRYIEKFNLEALKKLINKYGKTKRRIAQEIIAFTNQPYIGLKFESEHVLNEITAPEFYAYYGAYDWVVFCQLWSALHPVQPESFETGMSYPNPKGFPYYCKDLKQMLDEKWSPFRSDYHSPEAHRDYPKQTNEHNALADANWNKELHKFIENDI